MAQEIPSVCFFKSSNRWTLAHEMKSDCVDGEEIQGFHVSFVLEDMSIPWIEETWN